MPPNIRSDHYASDLRQFFDYLRAEISRETLTDVYTAPCDRIWPSSAHRSTRGGVWLENYRRCVLFICLW